MNIKSLVTTSVVALISASVVQAADVVIPHEATPVITAPTFSWTGFYIGGQIGGFSSKVKVTNPDTKERIFTKDGAPKPSGFMGGIYVGSNIDLGHGLVLGIETDAIWADRGDTKSSSSETLNADGAIELNQDLKDAGIELGEAEKFVAGDTRAYGATLKEKWSGATRVRIGFAVVDRIMPYISGGITYAQMQGIDWVSGIKKSENNKLGKTISANTFDKTKMFVGYTLGGGIDFAMTDNVLFRAEYRYSDYGKKKFDKDGNECSYKTNDLRVGVAYKF
ncbi:porin [Bartonella sp. MM73XJBT]|uniref:porin n=1 Tax=Bartonella sp. MM73XJBT TaxID=3019095 RepID=UPI00235E43BB|nr:outer membrane protein [Bartonella sp. MM73XJBT]